MVINLNKCNGCYNCFLACKDEHCGNDYLPYSAAQPYSGHFWMKIIERERGTYPKVKVAYIAVPCMHCNDAACVTQAPDNTVYKRPDGIVIIDPVKAEGHKEIVNTCPYRVIYWNEGSKLPQKCTLCAHLIDQGWKEPRCVEACPTGALVFGNIEDKTSEIARIINSSPIEMLHPEYGLNPSVKYIGIPKRFIAGAVILQDKPDECPKGVKVTIRKDKITRVVLTDNYGDFEFEGLGANHEYILTIDYVGYKSKTLNVHTKTDVNIGEIVLSR